MIWFIFFTTMVFVCGFALGTWTERRQFRQPPFVFREGDIYLSEWRKLELPPSRRRQPIPTVRQ